MTKPSFHQAIAWGVKTKRGILTPLNCTTKERAKRMCYKGAKPVRILVTLVEVL